MAHPWIAGLEDYHPSAQVMSNILKCSSRKGKKTGAKLRKSNSAQPPSALTANKLPPRERQIIRSLAICVAALHDHIPFLSKNWNNVVKSFHNTLDLLFSLDLQLDQDLDIIKYYVNLWFQKAVGDLDFPETGHKPVPLPSAPALVDLISKRPNRLFSGLLGDAINLLIARARKRNAKAVGFLFSFLLSKRGWPELGMSKCLDSVADHQSDFGTQPPEPSSEILEGIRDTVKQIVASGVSLVSKEGFLSASFPKFNPSLSASFRYSRKQGGARKEVEDLTHVALMDPNPKFGILRGAAMATDEYRQRTFAACQDSLKDPIEGSGPTFDVRLQVLPEPGKFRIITAGDALLYSYLQPLQGFLLSQWKKSKFSTMKDDWAETLMSDFTVPPGWSVQSVDYKAATDKLNIFASMEAMKMVEDLLGVPIVSGIGLGITTIHYPKKSLREGMKETVVAFNGQLMGHPLSFPLLCFINLAGIITFFRQLRQQKRITPEEYYYAIDRIRVNGDDAGFMCPHDSVPLFEAIAKEHGLHMSLGKTYSSEYFFMINNRPFICKSGKWSEVGYLNQKLILNHSLKNGESEKSPFEIGRAFNKMFELFPPSLEFLPDCIKNRQNLVPIQGFHPNFFFPCALGGFGVDPKFCKRKNPDGSPHVISTRRQRLVAALMAEDTLSSFLFRRGKSLSLKSVKMMESIPKIERVPPLIGPLPHPDIQEEERIQMEKELDNYLQWESKFRLYDEKLDPQIKVVNFKKIKKLNPMSHAKIFSFDPKFHFPVLPPCPPSSYLFYRFNGHNNTLLTRSKEFQVRTFDVVEPRRVRMTQQPQSIDLGARISKTDHPLAQFVKRSVLLPPRTKTIDSTLPEVAFLDSLLLQPSSWLELLEDE